MSVLSDIDNVLSKVKRIHMVGIGGSGMFPLAEILHAKGYKLSGSDNNESDILKRVRKLGIPVFLGHAAENLGDAEMVVQTAALLPNNPEIEEAKKRGIPIFSRAELFGAVSRHFDNCIAVAGTHGKTTVTSMIVHILYLTGKDPSAVIGGKLPTIDSYGRIGGSDIFVGEACEFADTFLHLSPACSIILNVDEDHLDYFKTMDNLKASFRKFADKATRCIVYNGDDKNTLEVIDGLKKPLMISFGERPSNTWYAANINKVSNARHEFDIIFKGEKKGTLKLAVPGYHNVLNALAAIAVCDYAGVSVQDSIKALESFMGAGRRFEILGRYGGVTIADDYAHHPRELKVTLQAAKAMDYKRVWAVFQPFTYSRTYMLMDDFADVLKIADKVVMTEIMGSREINTYGVETSQLAAKIKGSVWFKTFEEVAKYVTDSAEEGDLIITLGCGDIYKAAKMMCEIYESKGISKE